MPQPAVNLARAEIRSEAGGAATGMKTETMRFGGQA
jgi:hypothetical protein